MIVSANMATYPARINVLETVVKSIVDQVDVLRIYFNEYTKIPEFIYKYENIEYVIGRKNITDNGKFYWASNPNEYYFTIDDDIEYPKTYVKDTIKFMNYYNDNIIVSLHGRLIFSSIKNFYEDLFINFNCLNDVYDNVFVNFVGTGVMTFCTNNFKVNYKKFKNLSMSDCYISVLAQKQKIPILVRKHTKDYLTYLLDKDDEDTIYMKFLSGQHKQCKIINSVKNWKLHIKLKKNKKRIVIVSILKNIEKSNYSEIYPKIYKKYCENLIEIRNKYTNFEFINVVVAQDFFIYNLDFNEIYNNFNIYTIINNETNKNKIFIGRNAAKCFNAETIIIKLLN